YKIYRNKKYHDGYKEIEKYIISKRKENLKISEFLIKFYIDKMLNLKDSIANVDVCKNIIYESESFIENIKLLNINFKKEYKIYRNKKYNDGYKEIEKYIIYKRKENLKISEFLIKFYIDKMLNLKDGIANVDVCKNIIYESESFIENIKLLNINPKKEEKIF